jgi:hypothetical protein
MGGKITRKGISHAWRTLTREQRLSVGVLAVCGLVAVLLGAVQVRRLLISPFTAPVEDLIKADEMRGQDQAEIEREQQRTDTDGDGISDWHELNVFKTSPYIRDSDSDGEPDNIEIAKGTDPNCPKGEVCVSVLSAGDLATSTGRISLPGTSSDGAFAFPQAGVGGSSPVIPDRDPEAIRAFLRARGSSEAELSMFSDEDILRAYDEAAYGSMASDEEETAEGAGEESVSE